MTEKTVAGPWLTLTEAAERLGITRQTLNTWIKKGQGPPFYVLGNRRRFRAPEIEEFLTGRKEG